ncbi:MAG: hypothetical protein IID41_07945 [Planctomycetes bacterium]|nr:hypothetical protein [Planctomycetota bacterium]
MPVDVEEFARKMANVFIGFEDRLELFEGAEAELIAAAGVLLALHARMVRVRRGEGDDERDADLFAMREHRIAESEDRRAL